MTTKYKKTGEPFDVIEAWRCLLRQQIIILESCNRIYRRISGEMEYYVKYSKKWLPCDDSLEFGDYYLAEAVFHSKSQEKRITAQRKATKEKVKEDCEHDFRKKPEDSQNGFNYEKEYCIYCDEEKTNDVNDHPLLVEAIKNREAVKVRAKGDKDIFLEISNICDKNSVVNSLQNNYPLNDWIWMCYLYIDMRDDNSEYALTWGIEKEEFNEIDAKEYDFANKRFVSDESDTNDVVPGVIEKTGHKLTPEMLERISIVLTASKDNYFSMLNKTTNNDLNTYLKEQIDETKETLEVIKILEANNA